MANTDQLSNDEVLAWHFVGNKLKDGRPLPKSGVVLKQSGTIVPCKNGLHGSIKIVDGLRYAPIYTKWICRTKHSGIIVSHNNDKIASSERTILWKVKAEPILCEFVRLCALDVIHSWNAPDVVKEYLETSDEKIRSAAWRAARSTARSAVQDAAWSAVQDAAWSAAQDAAWSAAWSAARSAAWSAVQGVQNTRLTHLVLSAKEEQQ